MLKKITLLIAAPTAILLVLYLITVFQNNRDVTPVPEAQVHQHLEKSIQWLLRNETKILSQTNVMLWWMLYEAHKISNDSRLAGLLDKYLQRNQEVKYGIWGVLFDGSKHRYLDAFSFLDFPYYNQHFVYALNCAESIAEELPIVAQQNDASFCHQPDYFYRPACTTHQLMGINFLLTNNCGFLRNIDEVIRSLQQDIIIQLTWDVRVVDVYLQRVLMLLITNAESSIKPIWMQKVLDNQLDDGGWGNFVSLISLPGGKSIGYSARGISMGREKSDFHATAQGVYILTYLLFHKE